MIFQFYTGSYGQKGEDGIALFSFDTEKKSLTKVYGFSEIPNPSWVLSNAACTRLYAVQEQTPEGMVHELAVEEGGLRLVRSFKSGGSDPCHLSLDEKEEFLLCADYTSGALAVYALNPDGGIDRLVLLDQHEGGSVNPQRQASAHVHFSREHDGLFYVCDLGMDCVFVYGRDADGQLVDTGSRLVLPAGLGPRHLEFDERRSDLIYVICELGNCIAVFQREADNYELLQLISTLPEGFDKETKASAIRRSGDLIFAANRGYDSIAVFGIQKDGTLVQTAIVPSCGENPRDMQIFGNYLIVADQDSDLLSVFKIDPEQKTVKDTGIRANTIRPSCICSVN